MIVCREINVRQFLSYSVCKILRTIFLETLNNSKGMEALKEEIGKTMVAKYLSINKRLKKEALPLRPQEVKRLLVSYAASVELVQIEK